MELKWIANESRSACLIGPLSRHRLQSRISPKSNKQRCRGSSLQVWQLHYSCSMRNTIAIHSLWYLPVKHLQTINELLPNKSQWRVFEFQFILTSLVNSHSRLINWTVNFEPCRRPLGIVVCTYVFCSVSKKMSMHEIKRQECMMQVKFLRRIITHNGTGKCSWRWFGCSSDSELPASFAFNRLIVPKGLHLSIKES